MTNANAGTPKPKYLRASAVNATSSFEKDPYPNKALTISSHAIINPKLAGTDNNNDNSKDLFCIFEIFFMFFVLKALDNTGKETVPTAIPAMAKLI